MGDQKKYRVQLDFDQQGFDELEALKRELRAGSRADTVRYGLGLLHWAAEQLKSGARILTEKDGELRGVVFPFLPTPQVKTASTEAILKRSVDDRVRERRERFRDLAEAATDYGRDMRGQEISGQAQERRGQESRGQEKRGREERGKDRGEDRFVGG